jgi:hypothetical protein
LINLDKFFKFFSKRPQNTLINNIIHQFKILNIKSIFNLQVKNEHVFCGQRVLKESGFSYDPQDFIKNGGIYYLE